MSNATLSRLVSPPPAPAVPAPTLPLANLTDGNPATLCDFPGVVGNSYYAVFDYGYTQTFSTASLHNLTLGGPNAPFALVKLYCSDALITDRSFSGMTAWTPTTTDTQPYNAANITYAPPAGANTGRYLYAVPQDHTTCTIGEASVTSQDLVPRPIVIPVPTLTATPTLINNVPTIMLSGF